MTALLETNAIIGSYRILRLLGRGGMGEVYEVEHVRLGTRYALKAFALDHGDVDLLRERFVAEGKVLARLSHPNLVRVFELDHDPRTGVLYFVMDLVRGARSFMDLEDTPAEEAELARWFGQLVAALDYIHGEGIVHRDVKPSNILVDENGNVRLVDFGVSRYVSEAVRQELAISQKQQNGEWRSGTFNMKMGTGDFMAPEVRAGKPATAASDAYSLGLVFFHLLTGVWYEPGRNPFRLLEPLELGWRAVLEPLLRRNPAERPATLTALSGRLDIPVPEVRAESALKSPWRIVFGSVLVAGIVIAVSWPIAKKIVRDRKGDHSVTQAKFSGKNAPPFGKGFEIEFDDNASMKMKWCPPGEFDMGSPGDEEGRYRNEDLHHVKLTKGFWIADRETTQGQWFAYFKQTVVDLAGEALLSPEPDDLGCGNFDSQIDRDRSLNFVSKPAERCGGVRANYPVYFVTWQQATNFCHRLSEKARSVDGLPFGYEYRLPTEAEWEYACRAGSKTGLPGDKEMHLDPERDNYCRELDAYAWFGGNSCKDFVGKGFNVTKWSERMYPGKYAAPHYVGTREPNCWGIYDMLGNVWEWCVDWYGPYDLKQSVDPKGPDHGQYHVVRGGSWSTFARQTRAAYRDGFPNGLGNFIGFRVVLGPKLK